MAHLRTGQLERALVLLEEAVNRGRAQRGHDHPDTLNTAAELAKAYRQAGQLTNALALLEDTLTRRQARLGLEDRHTVASMGQLARAYIDGRQFEKAEPMLVQCYEELTRREAQQPSHGRAQILQATVERLVQLYQAWGKPEKAAEWRKKSKAPHHRRARSPEGPSA